MQCDLCKQPITFPTCTTVHLIGENGPAHIECFAARLAAIAMPSEHGDEREEYEGDITSADEAVADLVRGLRGSGSATPPVVAALLHHVAALAKFEAPMPLLDRIISDPYFIAARQEH